MLEVSGAVEDTFVLDLADNDVSFSSGFVQRRSDPAENWEMAV